MAGDADQNGILQSLGARITAVATILGAFIAAAVPAAEGVRGWFEMRVNEADHKQQITIEFLKLLTTKDANDADRERVLEVLARTTDQDQLRGWAQTQIDGFKAERVARNSLLNKRETASTLADAQERAYKLAEVDVATKQAEILDANSHYASMETVRTLLDQLTPLEQQAATKKIAWQQSKKQVADLTTAITKAAVQFVASTSPTLPFDMQRDVTVERVSQLFPQTPRANIERNLPFVLSALTSFGLTDKTMVLVALATIRAETPSFVPIPEGQSRYNTPLGGAPFSLYDPGTQRGRQFGNTEPGDGARFKGRGYVQLTGRANYRWIGQQLKIDLLSNPDMASDAATAALILARFMKSSEAKLRDAVKSNDLARARRLVDGDVLGIDIFTSTYSAGDVLLVGPQQNVVAAPQR